MDFKNRLKNYGLWIAVIAFIPMFVQSLGLDILPANYKEIAMEFLGMLVLLGIVNNPATNNSGFKDDEVE